MRIFSRIIFISFICFSTIRCNKKNEFYFSERVSDSLYLEVFHGFQGGIFGDVLNYYLTDSLTFRSFIISKQDKDHVYYKVITPDQIVFFKKSRRKANLNSILDSVIINISDLKRNGKYE